MNAFPAAKRALIPLILGALVVAAPALAAESGYLGVMLQDLSPAMAKALQLGDQSGVLVSDVVDDSPAEKAGLQDGDVIIAFAGKPLSDYESLTKAVRAAKPGDKVDVTVLRDGKKKTIQVELGEQKDSSVTWTTKDHDLVAKALQKLRDRSDDAGNLHYMTSDRGWLGVGIDDLSDQLGEYFGVKDGDGVLVTSVEKDSPAAKAGLKAGDVIVKIDGDEVEDTGDLHEALADTKADQKVKIEYLRKGKDRSADVTLGEMPEGSLPSALYFGDDDNGVVHMKAPKMVLKRMQGLGKGDMRVMTDPEHRIEIIREKDDAQGDIKQLRKELQQLREELDKLREQVQKK